MKRIGQLSLAILFFEMVVLIVLDRATLDWLRLAAGSVFILFLFVEVVHLSVQIRRIKAERQDQ